MALRYYNGEGVQQDFQKAMQLFREAADRGCAKSQCKLGVMYETGKGVEQNKQESVRWYRMAADQGLAEAQNNLGNAYRNGEGVEQNNQEAARWFRMAAEQGFAAAQNNLGCAYDDGEGVEQNKQEGVRWFRMAADQGFAAAQNSLGCVYMNGDGVEQNKQEALRWFRMAADQGNAEAQNSLGYAYHNGEGVEQNKQEGVRWFRMAADQGFAEAQFNLGIAYKNGEGVEKNDQEGVRWYRMAADQGNAIAQNNLGDAYRNGEGVEQNNQEVAKWFRMAADQGHAEAQYNLGYAYDISEGVEQNLQEALRWYRMAADQGFAAAQYCLGNAYKNGEGVEQNKQEGVRWFRMAADQGNAKAQNNLGNAYMNGDGVEQNKQEALRWFRMAADQGNAEAQNSLGYAYWTGEVVEQNKQEAVRWFRMAAEQGVAAAQYNLGCAYKNGEGVEQNKQEALRWFRMAADQGFAQAQNNLGNAYWNGEGVEQNKQEALRWYRMAANQGFAKAQNSLGYAYKNGEGVEQNKQEALRWYRMAAEHGDSSAQFKLGLAYWIGDGVEQNKQEAVRFWQLAALQGHAQAKSFLDAYYSDNESVVQNHAIRGDLGKNRVDLEKTRVELKKNRVDVEKLLKSYNKLRKTIDDHANLEKSIQFDETLFEKWGEDQALKDFSRHESVVNEVILQISDDSLDRDAILTLAKQRDEAVRSCLSSVKKLIAREEMIKPRIEEFCRLRSHVLSERKKKKKKSFNKKVDIDSFVKRRHQVVAEIKSFNDRFKNAQSDTDQAAKKATILFDLLSKSVEEIGNGAGKLLNNASTIRHDFQQAMAAETKFNDKERSILAEKVKQISNLMLPLCDTHYSAHVRVFVQSADCARRRLPELEARSVGAPSLELLNDCSKQEKRARKKYIHAKVDLDLDSDSEDEAPLTSDQRKQNVANALGKWREKARELERVANSLSVQAATLFPELIYESKIIRDNIETGMQSSRAREQYDDLAQLPGRHHVSKVRIDDRVCVLKAYSLTNEHSHRAFRKEVKFLSQLTHPHVVKLTAAFIESNTGYVEMPFYEYGDLWQWKKTVDPDANLLQLVFRSALLGLSFVHSMDVIHSDVKPGNIFVDSSHCAKLGDFDVSKDDSERVRDLMTTAVVSTSVGFTVSYVAPELLTSGSGVKPSKASDVYAFGLCLFDVHFSNAPGESKRPSVAEIAHGLKEICFPDDADEELKQTLTALLKKDPIERSSCSDALSQLTYFSLSKESSSSSADVIVQNCLICDKATVISKGIVCPSQQQHFQCDECLSGYFSAFTSADDGVQLLVPDGSGVKCPFPTNQEHDCKPYDDAQLARLLPADVFQQSMAVRRRHAEQQLAFEFEAQFQQRLRERDAQGAVQRHRQYIIERILNLACPRCSLAFYDFDACFAITCSRCRCGFCAWCFQDCGSNANTHHHVRRCRMGTGGIYGTVEQFDESNRVRRQHKVRAYLANEISDPDLRKQVIQACKKEFKDLNLKL